MGARIVAGLMIAIVAFAQTRQFEVASVRPNHLDDRMVTIDVGPGGRFAARGYTLVLLIQRAWGVMDWNVTGGPGWIRTDRFNVVAKAKVQGDLREDELQPMLQHLLADRFQLRLHKSEQRMAGYAMVVSRGGPRVKASADTEPHPYSFRFNATGLSGHGVSMYDFTRFVTGKLGLIAADETGLTGLYDFDVSWKVEAGDDPRDALQFSVRTALEEQLGLKLVPKRITLPTLVIDSVEKPSAN